MCRKRGNLTAWAVIVLGAVILLGLLLPRWLWLLLCGCAFLTGGVLLLTNGSGRR